MRRQTRLRLRRGRTLMRVGVNLLWLVPGEVGGSQEYTVRLLDAVKAEHADDVELVVYLNRRGAKEFGDRFGITKVAPASGSSRLWRVLTESVWLAWRTRKDKCQVVHHAGGTMPIIRTADGIVTLHDLQPLEFPERFGFIKRNWIRFIAPRSLRKADAVVCLSSFTATDATVRAGVDPERIVQVPCGVLPPLPDNELERRETLGDYDIDDHPFVLFPAITYPHKNHESLIAAFAGLRASHPDLLLVLTGGAGSSEESVLAAINAYGVGDYVRRTGRVSESELNCLYRSASVMAFPSLYEGFGLPVLEAMVRGCPVVASNAGALPIVAGDAAQFVNPLDVRGWVATIDKVLTDNELRNEMVQRGYERVTHFAWPDSARRLLDLYRTFA